MIGLFLKIISAESFLDYYLYMIYNGNPVGKRNLDRDWRFHVPVYEKRDKLRESYTSHALSWISYALKWSLTIFKLTQNFQPINKDDK